MKYHKTILTYIDLWTWRGSCYCTMSLRGTSLTCTHQNDSLAPTFMYTYLHVHRQPFRLGLGDLGTWGQGDKETGCRYQSVHKQPFQAKEGLAISWIQRTQNGKPTQKCQQFVPSWGREEEEEEEEEREQQQNISMIYYNILYIRNIILIHV